MIRIKLSSKLGEHRWTQADLARATGIRPATVSAYYNEFTDNVNLVHLSKICKALECEPSDILVVEDDGDAEEIRVNFTVSTSAIGKRRKRKNRNS